MSVFSDMLKNYIHEKDIKVGALAHYCNLERSTIYKFINGKREPASEQLVEQISCFIQLTPAETNRLKESWKMARMGEDTYYIHKSIEHFLCDFPNVSPASHTLAPQYSGDYFQKGQNCLLLNSRQAVDSSMRQIILSEAAKKNGRIALFLQPDYPFLLQLLSTIRPTDSLQIDHIFGLNRTVRFTESHELYELYYLRNLFPIYMNKLDYRIHCFYTNESQNLSVLPYMILTSEFAITCSSDYQMGILYQDADILQALWNLFHSHLDHCQTPFLSYPVSTNDLSTPFRLIANNRTSADEMIVIQPEACILSFLHGKLLEDIFNYELPMADAVISMANDLCSDNLRRIKEGKFIVYFTETGMTRFLQKGLMDEVPPIFYHPLNIEQRIQILREIAGCCHDGSYRILKAPLSHLSPNLRMGFCGNVCPLTYQTNDGELMCFAIADPFILQIFQDFLLHMDENAYYTPAEATRIIERMIESFKVT